LSLGKTPWIITDNRKTRYEDPFFAWQNSRMINPKDRPISKQMGMMGDVVIISLRTIANFDEYNFQL